MATNCRRLTRPYGSTSTLCRIRSCNWYPSQLKCDTDQRDNGIELKAGTEKNQHMVGVTPTAGGAQFEVVYLDQTRRSKR
jgi:hypothetical protein